MRKLLPILCLLTGFLQLQAQQDTIQLSGTSISAQHDLSQIQTQSEISLNDSILKKSQPSLTQILLFNSPIYFKESGAGMVASPSFRGTTASQTVVLWNGININSQTNGQTDFNTVSINGYDQINIKGGAGNIAEVNSSVGGSVELINELKFKNDFSNELFLRYGSFNTINGSFKSEFSTENLSFYTNYARFSSENDFEFPEDESRKNTNGQFYNNNINLGAAYKINAKNTLKFYGNLFQGRRNLAVVTPYATKSKYENYNVRSLLNWESRFGKFDSDLKLAYLTEEYRYFPNVSKAIFDLGEVNTLVAKYDLRYRFTSNFQLLSHLEFTRNEGFSGEEMEDKIRNLGAISLSAKHQVLPKFYYEISLRQELSEIYGNPLLYSLGGNWSVTDFYTLKFNASKNFRIPTYNDLYWPEVGNPDLNPETSYQAEIGNEFQNRFFKFSITAFYNAVDNLIRWIPNANPLGGILWRPENVEDVKIYGIESILSASKKFAQHQISLAATYAYTVSEDQKLNKQLIYVPYHKATASLSYGWKGVSVYSQFLFNGKVFTTTQNEPEHRLDHYYVTNLGLDYDFGKENTYKIGFEVLNLMDYEYENVEARPMPGRSFQVYLNIKI